MARNKKTLFNSNSNCKCELGLGVVKFPNILNGDDDGEDPLVELFKDCKFSFQNPDSKQKEEVSVFDIIHLQSHLSQKSDKTFKMFPPFIMPSEKIVPGFPKHLFNNDIRED